MGRKFAELKKENARLVERHDTLLEAVERITPSEIRKRGARASVEKESKAVFCWAWDLVNFLLAVILGKQNENFGYLQQGACLGRNRNDHHEYSEGSPEMTHSRNSFTVSKSA